ncbi:MAG: GyrI-like domain-containing protein [Candidatus Absconditabacterales bacterium]
MKFIKTLLRNLLTLIGVFIVLLLINRWYLDGFTTPEIKEQNMGPYTIAYVNFVGNYGKVGPSMIKVYDILSGAGVTVSTGIGIYYDDPAIVSGANLRSDVGAVIISQDVSKLIKNKEIKITTLPAGNKIVVEFPLKNTISYIIGPMKVYPLIAKYIKEKGYANQVSMIELYDMVAKKIYYIAEISK